MCKEARANPSLGRPVDKTPVDHFGTRDDRSAGKPKRSLVTQVPRKPGSYALFFLLDKRVHLEVGKLGRFLLEPGVLVYFGSAMGPGGLGARIARHLSPGKKRRWHVDYLQPHAKPIVIWFSTGGEGQECNWSKTMASQEGSYFPIREFGSSDCSCPSHLLHLDKVPLPKVLGDPKRPLETVII